MTPDDLTRILRTGDDQRREHTLGCPDEERLAAFADGLLSAEDRQRLELHLADCSHCLSLVGLLGRERDCVPTEKVPEIALARARKLGRQADRRWLQSAPRWAAAAVVLVAIPFVWQLKGPTADTLDQPPTPAERVTRNVAGDRDALDVLQPAAGATVEPDALTVRWTAIPGSDYYDMRIVTDAGALVVEQRVTGTEWHPSQPLALDRGTEYFLHVDAYPADGKAIGSAHVPFRTAE